MRETPAGEGEGFCVSWEGNTAPLSPTFNVVQIPPIIARHWWRGDDLTAVTLCDSPDRLAA